MILWLHENCSYTYFNIPDLTYSEIRALVDAKNRQVKKQNREQKRAEQKAKSRRR